MIFGVISQLPRHVAHQMRHQNVGLSNGHCYGTIIIFQLRSRDLFCACAVGLSKNGGKMTFFSKSSGLTP